MSSEIKSYPSPWNLNGSGYIFIYKFKKDFVNKNGNVPEFLQDKFAGGFGSLMLVNYKESNAGPYGELLFIPGKFRFNGKKLNTISKIYVSTMESVINGRANWAIPKEKADFVFETVDKKTEKTTVFVNNTIIASFTIKHGNLRFPVSTKLLPFPLVQKQDEKYYYTNFFGKGKGQFAKIKDVTINAELFPDVSKIKPIAVIRVHPFDITFPKAEINEN